MVRSKEDYDKQMDDSRFKRFDKVLDPSYGRKQYYILIAGIIIVCILFAVTTISNSLGSQEETTDIPYEKGLNISYIAKDKIISISFTNPNTDTSSVSTLIQVPFDTQSAIPSYLTVYEYSSSTFPINISYTPSTKISNINHYVTITLIKETGNYTYAYSVVPDTENKLWKGTGQYVQKITRIFGLNENS